MMSPLRSTFEGYRLPHISNVLVQLIMLLHQHCRKYHSKCVYHIAGVEKIYWWLFLNIKKMTARIWSAVYLETEEILKTIVRLLTKTLTMVRWANAGVTICWLGYDGFQLHEMKPLVPLLRNLIIKYFFLRGRPRRMFWFSLRFQEFFGDILVKKGFYIDNSYWYEKTKPTHQEDLYNFHFGLDKWKWQNLLTRK